VSGADQSVTTLEVLRRHLNACPPGPIEDRAELLGLLSPAWPSLDGCDLEAMHSGKLSRLEDPRWAPPILTFRIERHGPIVAGGSTRAEMQTWTVDIDDATASVSVSGRRQMRPMAPRLDVEPLVREIVSLANAGVEDDRLKWSPDRKRVTIRIGRVIPDVGYPETVQGRRKRFTLRLREAMTASGWQEVIGTTPHTFERPTA